MKRGRVRGQLVLACAVALLIAGCASNSGTVGPPVHAARSEARGGGLLVALETTVSPGRVDDSVTVTNETSRAIASVVGTEFSQSSGTVVRDVPITSFKSEGVLRPGASQQLAVGAMLPPRSGRSTPATLAMWVVVSDPEGTVRTPAMLLQLR